MVDEFGYLDGVAIAADDILIWGENHEQHDERLDKFFKGWREADLPLNPRQSVFSVNCLQFLGHVISNKGLEPTNEDIQYVIGMPNLTNKKELEAFLGMITYLGKFIPKLSGETAPLHEIMQEDVTWHWYAKHDKAMTRLKHLIVSSPVLGLYDVNEQVCSATDASNQGFGAVMMQNDRPIAYVSRVLNPAEKNICAYHVRDVRYIFCMS